MRKLFLLLAFFMTSCAPQTIQIKTDDSPKPYVASTPSLAPAPNVVVIVETPVPTATPFIYAIQSGDTFSQLAETFRVSQDELRAANPNVSPNSMPIGGTLLIPDMSAPRSSASLPTPAPVPVTQIICYPSKDSGAWCFALILNNTAEILENVSAQINLLDENNNIAASQIAFTPLNIIPPNTSLPVYIFFPNIPSHLNPQARLLSAVFVNASTPRYLSAKLENTITQLDRSGKSAHVSGNVQLPAESTAATQIWIAAMAYNKAGQVVGLKRWESAGSLQFNFIVSSLAGEIDKVELLVEARP